MRYDPKNWFIRQISIRTFHIIYYTTACPNWSVKYRPTIQGVLCSSYIILFLNNDGRYDQPFFIFFKVYIWTLKVTSRFSRKVRNLEIQPNKDSSPKSQNFGFHTLRPYSNIGMSLGVILAVGLVFGIKTGVWCRNSVIHGIKLPFLQRSAWR